MQEEIGPNDIIALDKVLTKASNVHKTPFWKTVCCVKCICRKDKHMKLQAKTAEAFESNLDIRRIVD